LKQPPKVGLDAMMMSKMYLKTVKKILLKKKIRRIFQKKNALIKDNSSLIKVEFLNKGTNPP